MPATVRMMGVDIGTNLGLAKIAVTGRLAIDSVVHSSSTHIGFSTDVDIDDFTARLAAFRYALNEQGTDCDRIWYEYVPPSVHTGAMAARVYGAFEGALLLWAREYGLWIGRVTIAEAKRVLTGDPGASKGRMMTAAGKWGVRASTHDQADALGVVLAGYKKSLSMA